VAQNLSAMLDEIRRQRRQQLDSILGRQGTSGGGLPAPMQAAAGRQHGDPKANLMQLAQGYDQAAPHLGTPSLGSLIGSTSTPVSFGVGAGSAVPAITGITAAPGAAGAAGSGILAAGTPIAGVGGGTGALGAIGSGLGAAGSAIGAGASAAASGIGAGISALLALL